MNTLNSLSNKSGAEQPYLLVTISLTCFQQSEVCNFSPRTPAV
jgi:hypothetical protein